MYVHGCLFYPMILMRMMYRSIPVVLSCGKTKDNSTPNGPTGLHQLASCEIDTCFLASLFNTLPTPSKSWVTPLSSHRKFMAASWTMNTTKLQTLADKQKNCSQCPVSHTYYVYYTADQSRVRLVDVDIRLKP